MQSRLIASVLLLAAAVYAGSGNQPLRNAKITSGPTCGTTAITSSHCHTARLEVGPGGFRKPKELLTDSKASTTGVGTDCAVDISAVSGSSISLSKHNMESMFDSVEKKCGSKFGTIEIAADAGAKTSDIVGTIKMVIRPAKSGEKSSG